MDCNNSNNNGRQECNDIPGGFQDLDPQLFSVVAELLGNVMAGNMPFNIQNAIGNWLTLVGQTILTYNAQQQYFQSGPGRYYNRANKNVSNPFCPQEPQQSSSIDIEGELDKMKEAIQFISKEIENLKNNIETFK